MILTTKNLGTRTVWNLTEMATEFGISPQAMSKWLRRRSHFTPDIELVFPDRKWSVQIWEDDTMKKIRKARKA
jgi:transcriptional regulator with XRE-family HTH domain